MGLNFVTKNFTTFFTTRKEIVTWNSLWEHPRLTNEAIFREMFYETPVNQQQPEGPLTEGPSTQESHPDHGRAFHYWSNHQDQAL